MKTTLNLWISPKTLLHPVPPSEHAAVAARILRRKVVTPTELFATLYRRGWVRSQQEYPHRINIACHADVGRSNRDWIVRTMEDTLAGGTDVYVTTSRADHQFEAGHSRWRRALRTLFD